MPRLLSPPSFPDASRTTLARQVWFLAWGIGAVVGVITFVELLVLPVAGQRWALVFACVTTLCGLSLWLARRGVPRTAARVLMGGLLLIAGVLSWSSGGIRAPITASFAPLVFATGLLLGYRSGLLAGLLAGAWSLLLALAEQTGQLPPSAVPHTALSTAIAVLLGLGLIVLTQRLASNEVDFAREQADAAALARRHTETALHESEQRLALALDAATDGIFDIDLPTGRAFCSPRYFTMLGYEPDEFAPSLDAWERLLHPDDRAVAHAAMTRYRDAHTGSHSIETRLRCKDGTWRWVLSRGRVASRDASGLPLRLIGTHVDIQERKQAELALQRAKDFAENLITTANALIVGLDAAGRVTIFNAAAELATGYTRAELVGRNWFETLVPRERYPHVWAEFARLQVGGLSERLENPLLTKTGEERLIVWRNNTLRDEGRITGTISFGIDVTEHRHAELSLAKERDLVARLIETSPAGITVVDRSGRIVFANPQAERVLGLKSDDLTQRSYNAPEWKITDPAGHPVAEEEIPFSRVLRTGLPVQDIHQAIQWPDGRRVLLSINASPLFDAAGAIEAVVATVADITERQRGEEAVRDSEERLRSIVDHAPFGSYVYELLDDGRLVLQSANRSADSIIGIDHRPLLGLDILEAFPGLKDTEVPAAYRGVITSGQPYHCAQVDYDQDNIRGAYDVHALPIGRQRLVVFFGDVTERQRAEAALRRSEERFRQLFNSGNDAVFVHGFRADGRPDRFSQVNDIACQLLGYTREELLARGPSDLNAPNRAAHAAEVLARLRRDHHSLFEMELLARDGHRVPVEINARVFELDGRPAVLSVVRDCTERKRLEDQLRQAQKMEVFGQLAGGVAHDFNNLLVAIIGNSELVLEGSELTGRPREQLEQIHDAGCRAAALTRQLLLFSRKQEPQRIPGDLGAIVVNHVKLLRRIIGEDINLTVELAPGPLPILADVNMLEQVAMNLVVNARDAMPDGGSLTLSTRRTLLSAAEAARAACPPGTYATLLVRDTGPGITPEIRTRIFEPFFTTKAAGKGTGLGLSTVLGIIQQHHGGIAVESEPGLGAEFAIHIPLASLSPAQPAPAAAPAVDAAAAPATVLVVEDDDSVRTIVEHSLRGRRYRVCTARSVAEGLEHLERADPPIDLVLSDVVMPGGQGGPQLAEQAALRWPHIPVVLMSGYARELEQTGTRILQKPFTIAQLLAFVEEGLRG